MTLRCRNGKCVKIDTLKWLMFKLFPKNWGDRLLVVGEAENPIRVLHEKAGLDRLTHEQLDVLEAFAQAMLQKQGERI